MGKRSSLYVDNETAERLRAIARRENRAIVTILDRMLSLYEPLTLVDHAIINKMARDLKLTRGQTLSHIVQSWQEFARVKGAAQKEE